MFGKRKPKLWKLTTKSLRWERERLCWLFPFACQTEQNCMWPFELQQVLAWYVEKVRPGTLGLPLPQPVFVPVPHLITNYMQL